MLESVDPILGWGVLTVYFGSLLVMSLYGLHRWYLVWLYLRCRQARPAPRPFETLPRLTVQLPLYNEMYVARRLSAFSKRCQRRGRPSGSP